MKHNSEKIQNVTNIRLTWLIVLSNVAGVIFDGDRNFERPFAENDPGTYSGEYSYQN